MDTKECARCGKQFDIGPHEACFATCPACRKPILDDRQLTGCHHWHNMSDDGKDNEIKVIARLG